MDRRKCRVVSYDDASEKYHIVFSNGGPEKDVKRLALCFDAEDEDTFFRRGELALDLRKQAGALRRYIALIKSQVWNQHGV